MIKTLLPATTASHFVTTVSEIVTILPESRSGLCVSRPCHKIGYISVLIYFFLSGALATPSVTSLTIESIEFPPTVKPPGSTNNFFLGGAGVRGIQIQDKFIKFTAIGVYLQDIAVPYLGAKWKGKPPHKLTESVPFFMDIVTGPFEKFMRVTMIRPLTGQEYSNKVSENCIAIWKSLGIYTNEEAKAINKFVSVFKDQTFPPGSSILFTVSPKGLGSLTISFSKDGSIIPEVETAVIENKLLSQAVLESMIGEHGVSPAAKRSLASRLSKLFKDEDEGPVLQ